MEIVPDNNAGTSGRQMPGLSPRNLFLGLLLILIGLVWLLHNFDIIPYAVYDVFFSWEMLLVIIGCYLLTIRRWVAGGIVAAIGLGFLLTDLLGLCIPFQKLILPVIFVAAGLGVIFGKNYRK